MNTDHTEKDFFWVSVSIRVHPRPLLTPCCWIPKSRPCMKVSSKISNCSAYSKPSLGKQGDGEM